MKLCLILQVLQCVVLTCLAKVCNSAAVRSLHPCGKPESYIKNMQFVLAGDYCYAESKHVWRYKLKWTTARQKCQRNGGDLAKFYLQKNWDDILKKNKNRIVFDTTDIYWTGGRLARKGGWWWGDADSEGNAGRIGWDGAKIPWDGGTPTNSDLNCLRIRNNLWYAGSCRNKQHFLCQKPGLSAYNTKTLIQANREEKDGGVHFNYRDTAMISCSARSEKGLNVTIVTKSFGTFSITSKTGLKTIEKISVIDVQRRKGFKHIDTRCIDFYNMTVKIFMTPDINDSVITCSNINRTFSSSSSSLRMFVHHYSDVPIVTVPGLKEFNGQIQAIVGQKVNYICFSKIGLQNSSMSFVIKHGKGTWTVSISQSGEKKEAGIPPKWVRELAITSRSGTDPVDKAPFVNTTVAFIYTREMDHSRFGCYSRDVRKEFQSLKKSDPVSYWIDFGVAGFSAKLEVTNQAGNEVLDANAVSQCETILVTCTGLGVGKRAVSFSIGKGDTLKVWRFGTPRKFRDNAEVLGTRELVDPVYGQSFEIKTTWSVLTDLREAKLECHAKNEDDIVTDTRKLILQPRVGTLPPKLTSNRYDGKDLVKHVTLECTSQLGPITTQSWKIIDENGLVNIILVQDNRKITGITFNWLKVKVIDAIRDECGHIIKTQATMLKEGLTELGVTFTCYSYDITIRSNKPVSPRYTRRELKATYSIFGGGGEKKEEEEEKKVDLESVETNLVWYAVLFVALSITLFVLLRAISRKKKAPPLEKNMPAAAKLSDSSVREKHRPSPSYGALQIPDFLKPPQASSMARSGTASESLPSTYTKASKNSHVKAYSESAAF